MLSYSSDQRHMFHHLFGGILSLVEPKFDFISTYVYRNVNFNLDFAAKLLVTFCKCVCIENNLISYLCIDLSLSVHTTDIGNRTTILEIHVISMDCVYTFPSI